MSTAGAAATSATDTVERDIVDLLANFEELLGKAQHATPEAL